MILFVTTADTDLLTAGRALEILPADFPQVKAFNPATLPGEGEQDAILAAAAEADVVVLRLLGGKRAMPENFDPLVRLCHERGIPLIACPGHQEWDQDLVTACTVPPSELDAVFSYLIRGGVANFENLFLFLSDSYLGSDYGHEAPAEVSWEGIYHPDEADGMSAQDFVVRRFKPGRPSVAVLFYRAHWMSGNLQTVDALVRRLEELETNVMPVYSFSLKHNPEGDGQANRTFSEILCDENGDARVDCIINTMGMSMTDLHQDGATFAAGPQVDYLDKLNVPIIQGIFSTGNEAEWEESSLGLGPIDTAMSVALPEFDGRIITVPISFKEEVSSESVGRDGKMDARLQRNLPRPDRIDLLARLSAKWASLRLKPNADKRIAIILSNYPTKDARVGNAVGLDTPASVINVLNAMAAAGYTVTDIPADGDELVHRIIERCSNDTDTLTEEQLRLAAGHVSSTQYKEWFRGFPQTVQNDMVEAWGQPPGQVYRTGDNLAIAGIDLGNVFVGLQPPRGFGENPISVYHSPDLVPTHHYIAYYRWMRDVFKADAMVHVGKHGTLEWLPGKGIGLSAACYPEVALDDVPLFYPFIINNPGEGAQAKRRAHATIIDHLIPAMTTADSYGDIARLEQLMDEHYQCQTLDPAKLPLLEGQIWDMVRQADLDRDLGVDEHPEDFGDFILHIDGYLCELKDAQIRDGLHTLGEVPQDEQMTGLLSSLTRLDTGGIPSLRRSLAEAMGLDYTSLLDEPALPAPEPVPAPLAAGDGTPVRTQGDLLERLEELSRSAYTMLDAGGFKRQDVAGIVLKLLGTEDAQSSHVLNYVTDTLHPALLRTTDEIGNLLRGLDGQFVPAGPSGAPTRGMSNILPTGRNFYSVDPKTIPSPTAWDMGVGLANALLQVYLEEEGGYPEMVGLVIWGTSAMRTHGDDIAQVFSLLGIKPVWQEESRRITGLEVIPLADLGRPRIDVTVRISGFFRDAFPNLIELIDQAVELVASLDESPEDNMVVKHLREDAAARESGEEQSAEPTVSQGNPALYRIFGSKPGTYGAGILAAIDERNWESVQDLAEVYTAWGGYAYTRQDFGVNARNEFRRRFSQIVVAAKNQDNREHDIFDSDDYMQYHGGMIATVRALTGSNPQQFFGDSSDPTRARVRKLEEEARRVFRTRVVNPKWIDSMKRHGYKGAFELSATVDYMFGYDATAQVIEDWMYENVTESYVLDPETQEFFQQSNPWALRDIVERLLEAIERGMWENPPEDMKEKLQNMFLDLEADLEARQEGPQS
ncbi:MAG: cobaltochelatase subunit CobN [Chloroflexi bacterium]|nr:cobaltochelatase subunit CobN [Chloroflexota bacterium]MDA1269891.1 cobaltochelatase subunit CobN [Chloroflexota bacterium]PKB59489.1 MAG: cobaltochelatase subunit CobN [SAR202 cluster bacterium Casp-Chloro-G2]